MTYRTFTIARRAYGTYTKIKEFTGTWAAAECHAMQVQADRRDGEYHVFFPGEEMGSRGPSSSYQSGMDWL
jgi:hypothetical protein